MSGMGSFTEKRVVAVWCWLSGVVQVVKGDWGGIANGYKVSVASDRIVLKLDYVDCCIPCIY
jgi:hypothetical protein